MIWLVALIGLGRRADRRAVVAAWVTALVALAMAVVLSRLVVSVPPVGTEVRPWVGAYLLLGFGALVLGRRGRGRRADRRDAAAQLHLAAADHVLASVLVGLVTVGGAGWWVAAGATGPIDRTRLDAIPPYVLNGMTDRHRARVLAIDLSGRTARYSVLADDQVRLGDADRGWPSAARRRPRQVADLVVRLVAGTADADIATQLARARHRLRLGHRGGRRRHRADRQHAGLGTASGNERGTVWQLEPAGHPRLLSTAPPGCPLGRAVAHACPRRADGRTLRIGEAADRRWQAELDGRTLTAGRRRVATGVRAAGRRVAGLVAAVRARLVPARTGPGAAGRRRARRPGRTAARGPRPDQVGPAGRDLVGGGLMSDYLTGGSRHPGRRRVVAVLGALLGLP